MKILSRAFLAALLMLASLETAYASPSQNTLVGPGTSAPSLTTGTNNVFMGNGVASSVTTGSNNVVIGVNGLADLTSATTSNEFSLWGNASTAIVKITGMNVAATSAMSVAGTLAVTGSITGGSLSTAAGRIGTFTANGASNVTVTNTNILVTSIVVVSLNTVGGTVGNLPHVTTITSGTSFTVAGTASDTSVYNYMILN